MARLAWLLFPLAFLASCNTEVLRQQEELIRKQQEELARQRKEIEELKLAQQREQERREACNRAFRSFEQAQAAKDRDQAIALYRKGLALCPDDDVAHYELGKLLLQAGKRAEARTAFEAALQLNPNFTAAREALDGLDRQ
jgi:tetratricopeptide (TPR) repeat protein